MKAGQLLLLPEAKGARGIGWRGLGVWSDISTHHADMCELPHALTAAAMFSLSAALLERSKPCEGCSYATPFQCMKGHTCLGGNPTYQLAVTSCCLS